MILSCFCFHSFLDFYFNLTPEKITVNMAKLKTKRKLRNQSSGKEGSTSYRVRLRTHLACFNFTSSASFSAYERMDNYCKETDSFERSYSTVDRQKRLSIFMSLFEMSWSRDNTLNVIKTEPWFSRCLVSVEQLRSLQRATSFGILLAVIQIW